MLERGLTVSRRAEQFIADRGGHVYVWATGGGQLGFLRISTDRPRGISFTEVESRPTHVHVAEDIAPLQLEIALLPWPVSRLTVDAGMADGGGGGG